MADRLVVGIYPASEPQTLQQAVSAQPGLDVNRMRVLTNDERTKDHEESGLHFVHVIREEDAMNRDPRYTHDTGEITDFGGTDVPGINWGANLSSFYSGEGTNLLIELGIPDDEAENFSDAIEEDRYVVLYNAGDDTAKAEAALKAAGLKNVHTFEQDSSSRG